jgi:hypothetical protein
LGEIKLDLRFNDKPYIDPIIDLNQTPDAFDLAMIARRKVFRYHGPGIRIRV